jgi:transposase
MQLKKGAEDRLINRSRGGMTTKIHVICDDKGRARKISITAGNVSDYEGGALLLNGKLPTAKVVIADRGYDSKKIRKLIRKCKMKPCIPSRCTAKIPARYSKPLYGTRHRVENFFARLKDWRRIATRYDRCQHNFLAAVLFASSCISFIYL